MNKNKLHTLSKYEADRLNRIAFMPDERKNLFVWAGPLNSATNQKTFGNNTTGNILSGYNINNTGVGSNVFSSTPAMQQAMNNVFPTPILQDYTVTPFQRRDIGPKVDNVTKTTFSNSFKIPNITINSSNDGKTFSIKEAFGKDALKAAGKTALNAGIGIAGNLVGQGAKAAISGGRSSDIGNGISSLGSTVGGAVGMANPLLGAAITAGSGVLGGLWNGAFGAKWNKENIADVENNIAQMRATDLGSVNSNAALLDAWGQVNLGYDFDQNYIGKNGWLNHKATRKYNKLNAMQKAARAYVQHQLGVAADQADRTQDDLAQSTFIYSDGGFLDNLDTSDMGEATKYSLAQDYLTMKNNKINTDAKIANMYASTPGTFFAEGGPKWTTLVGTVGPGGFIPDNNRGTYGGGSGGGAGTGTRISDIPEYETTVQKDTIYIPVERTFNDAFRDAVRNGLDTFDFDGKIYTTKFSDNPNWKSAGDARREIVDLLPYVWEHKKTEIKKSEGGPLNVLCGGGKMFAIGGDMQTNGGDFSTGLSHIDAGLSHELNPNEGVQVGVDSQGIPNLVEEGEVIWDDYVFSARIGMDDESKEVFHVNKKRDITYADQAKRLEREIKERPNDPISKTAFNAQMEKLQEQQERQKAEMEAQRAQEAFAALSPEEQTAVMQQVAQQEQAAQDAAMQEQAAQEQAIAEQQAMQGQPTPEEAQIMQQQQMTQEEPQMEQQQTMEPQAAEQPVMAYGGHKYDKGGVLELLNTLGYKTTAEAEEAGWEPSDFGKYTKWSDITSDSKISDDFQWNDKFNDRISSPAMKAALSLGWRPISPMLRRRWYEGDNGNNVGWTQSYSKDRINATEFKDYAKRYKNTLGWAIDNGIIKAPKDGETIAMSDIVNAMVQSPDWKATDKWLYDDVANQAAYLGMARGLNPDDDTKFINKWSPYGTFTKGADGNWAFNLKEGLSDAEKSSFTNLFKKARTDNKVGVMYNNFHDPGSTLNRYVLDDSGNLSVITDDDLSNYEQLGDYTWGDEAADINNRALIYRAKVPVNAGTNGDSTTAETDVNGTKVTTKPGEPVKKYAYRPNLVEETNLGMYGPLVNLGMMAAGIGKPDYTELDKALAIANRPVKLASYQPIGDYIKYRPMDIWAAQNRMDANARATDRAIMNSASPSNQAALLANAYTSQLGSGELFRQSLEYNDNLKKQVADFNRGTNIQNANAFNQLSQFNASQLNADKQRRAYMAANIAGQKMDADASWYNSLYGNVNSMFTNIANREREIRDRNWMAKMAADGLLGNLGDSYTGQGLITKYEVAKGGKLKRKKNKKKGLTI